MGTFPEGGRPDTQQGENTLYLWYRQGKLPPAVDVGPHMRRDKLVIVVPRYRLEAWQAGERMPSIFEEVFDSHGLHEPPWRCWSDVVFWVERRHLKAGVSQTGKRIYGEDLEEDKTYEICEGVN